MTSAEHTLTVAELDFLFSFPAVQGDTDKDARSLWYPSGWAPSETDDLELMFGKDAKVIASLVAAGFVEIQEDGETLKSGHVLPVVFLTDTGLTLAREQLAALRAEDKARRAARRARNRARRNQ